MVLLDAWRVRRRGVDSGSAQRLCDLSQHSILCLVHGVCLAKVERRAVRPRSLIMRCEKAPRNGMFATRFQSLRAQDVRVAPCEPDELQLGLGRASLREEELCAQ